MDRFTQPLCHSCIVSDPLILLEPVKPLSAYLAASGQFKLGMFVLVVGEILKITIVERPRPPAEVTVAARRPPAANAIVAEIIGCSTSSISFNRVRKTLKVL